MIVVLAIASNSVARKRAHKQAKNRSKRGNRRQQQRLADIKQHTHGHFMVILTEKGAIYFSQSLFVTFLVETKHC